ncbi:hypothetical protein [Agromyces bauzanensis]|uniref:Uncharacterized protein n=1 Tax=Agromyces bauzanensis TaxID=1308924 RepID=A0A917PF60_9MICO|nr:hypothetical protein [Agromyces bauzanensis]GGJ73978.1 hypothetical protein GCM10011372_10030 [Agromyces bauzanensis]
MTRVRGVLRLDDVPVAAQRVLVVPETGSPVVGATDTSTDGRFEVDVGRQSGPLMAVGRVSVDVLAVVHAQVRPDGRDTALVIRSDDLVSLSCSVVAPDVAHRQMSITIDPLHLSGVPDRFEPLLRRRDAGTVDAFFFRRGLDAPELTLRVQRGTYRFDASAFDRARPNIAAPDFENLVLSSVSTEDGHVAEPDGPFGGVRIDIDRPSSLTLELRVLPDAELLTP